MESMKEELERVPLCLSAEEKEHHLLVLTVSVVINLPGHGDQRDIAAEDGQGSGGRSDSWDEGTGGLH